MKIFFRASLLINCGFETVVVSVAPNLAVLPRTFLENNKTRDNSFISLELGNKGRSVNSESRICRGSKDASKGLINIRNYDVRHLIPKVCSAVLKNCAEMLIESIVK